MDNFDNPDERRPPSDNPPLPEGPLALVMPAPAEESAEPETTPIAETPYHTGLQISKERRAWLEDYAFKRMDEVRRDMGLTPDNQVEPESWMGIRSRNLMTFEGDTRWRATIPDSIFQKSNLTLGSGIRHVRYMAARVQDDLVGTTPFFAALGRNADKETLAKQAEQYVQDAVDKSAVRNGIRQAQKQALIVDEAVVKTTWDVRGTPFVGEATVLVDPAGQPIKTPKLKLYIFEGDNFIPDPNILQPGEPDPQTGEPAPPGPRAVVLEKDPSFRMVEGKLRYQKIPNLPQRLEFYRGPKSEPLHFTCFLCPLDAPTVHDADFCAHLFTETPLRMKSLYGDIDVSQCYFSEVTGDLQPKAIQGENDQQRNSVRERGQFAELYFRADADEDGEEEEIFMVVDATNAKVIFYDYLGNHFDKRPFEVIPGVERVAQRWYGRGIFSLTFDLEMHQDAEWNRSNVRASQNSQMIFAHRDAVEGWSNGLPMVTGGGQINWVNPNYSENENPPVFTKNLAPDNKLANEQMEISRQAGESLVGVISPADASQSDLNQSKTATGIVQLQAAGDVITKATEQDQTHAIDAILWQVVKLTLKHMAETTLMVTKDTSELVTLNADEVRSLEQDVRLTLTRSRSTQIQQVSAAAIQIAKDYRGLMLTDPEGARTMRDLYIAQLRGLEVNEADTVCPEITDDMIAQFQQAQQQQAQQQAKESRSISAKYSDLERSEQEQVLVQEGIKPAGPDEVAARRAEDKAAEHDDRNQPERKAA